MAENGAARIVRAVVIINSQLSDAVGLVIIGVIEITAEVDKLAASGINEVPSCSPLKRPERSRLGRWHEKSGGKCNDNDRTN